MAHLSKPLEIHYRLVGMPNETPPHGTVVHVEATAVETLEDGAIEVTLRYLDHD